jgi:hypothetical protein
MLHTAIEAFTSLPEYESNRPTRSVLPATVGMHLAQTLFQLCSRVQNRHQLQAIDIPFALCILFENISGQTKLLHEANSDSDNDAASVHSADFLKHQPGAAAGDHSERRAMSMDSIYTYIFHFDGIYSSRGWRMSAAGPCDVAGCPIRDSSCSSHSAGPCALKRDCSNDFLALYSANVDNKFLYRRNLFAKVTPSLRSLGQPYAASSGPSHTVNVSHPCLRQPVMSNSAPIMRLNTEDIMPIMASITSSCLDALTYFFADEVSRAPYGAAGFSNKNLAGGGSGTLRTGNAAEFTYKLYFSSIVDMMCSERVIDSIKMTSSFLTRGAGRLAAIRIISALSEWPESLTALYEGGIMDVLMLISSESEVIEAQRLAASKLENTERETGTSFFNSLFPAKPHLAERNTSGASTISAISSVTSRGRSFYNEPRGGWGGSASQDFDHNGGDGEEEDDDDGPGQISIEETMTVCYALGNMCEASAPYALRMFQSGLFAIMLKLVRSTHMEIDRHALRCISAMCASIAHDPVERAKYSKTKGKDASKGAVFLELLIILSDFLKSPSPLLQRDSVITMSLLALVNEQLQDAIVEGPLRTVTSMLVDPKNDRDMRAAAEDVLRNLGFLSGVKDFELCGYDFGILRDWYMMRRSLKPQEEALQLLREWVDNLFDENVHGTNARHQRQPGEHISSAHDLLHETASILNATIASLHGGGKAHAHALSHTGGVSRDSFDPGAEAAAFLSNAAHSSGITGGSSTPGGTGAARLIVPSLQRNITESLMRLWPFTSMKSPFQDCQTPAAQRHSAGAHAHSHNMSDDNYDNSPAAGGSQVMNRSLHPSSSLSNLALTPGYHGAVNAAHVSQAELYDWLDRPPLGILQLMELFYSSKLHQLLLMDMTSLGVALSTLPSFDPELYADAEEVASDYDIVYLLPRPHSVSAIMLPARSYQSFGRVGRVIEKMVEYSSDSSKLWSLIFRDSDYLGDFHTSLLSSLRRCPQICSLSFSSSNRVEDDALMGHLVGQLPPSVRFISFKSTLSKESIQALCILLRTHNAAFLNGDGDPALPKGSRRVKGTGAGGGAVGKGYAEPPRKMAADTDSPEVTPLRSKGLLGLALTHLTFEPTEINYIIELLQHRSPRMGRLSSFRGESSAKEGAANRDSVHGKGRDSLSADTRGRSNSDGSPKTNSNPNTPSTNPRSSTSPHTPHHLAAAHIGGLRFLDLSYNALNDLNCSRVLTAALNGPLEGLELGGNHIHRGASFCEAMVHFAADRMVEHRHRLRYLGLSYNALATKTVVVLLDSLLTNVTLTALDLSGNDIEHSVTIHEALRRFLRGNCGLRALDLCHNKLNPETFKEIHLGLLENETLLLLPMAGNTQVEVSPTVSLIQLKLRENRLLYKAQSSTENLNAQQGKLDAFQTEEELGMRISFGADFSDKELALARNGELPGSAVEMHLPVIAVEALDVVPSSIDAENCVPELSRTGSGLSLINPSTSRRNSRNTQGILDDPHPGAPGPPNPSTGAGEHGAGTRTDSPGTAAAAAAGDAGIKVPGYSIAIAVPVHAYDHPVTMGSSSAAYNYNNGRANVFANSASATTSPIHQHPHTQPPLHQQQLSMEPPQKADGLLSGTGELPRISGSLTR